MDWSTAPEFLDRMRALVDGGARSVVVDLGGAELLDHAGLIALVSASTLLEETKGEMLLKLPRARLVPYSCKSRTRTRTVDLARSQRRFSSGLSLPLTRGRCSGLRVVRGRFGMQRGEIAHPIEHSLERAAGFIVLHAIVGHAPLPPAAHQPGCAQQPERVAHGVLAGFEGESEVTDAELVGSQQRGKDTHPQGVDEQAQRRADQLCFALGDPACLCGRDALGIDGMAKIAHLIRLSTRPYG